MIKYLLLAFFIMCLVGCENKEEVIEKPVESAVEVKEDSNNTLKKELQIEVADIMTMEYSLIPYDIGYSKEYLKILNKFGADSESYTYMLPDSVYPLLIVKDGEDYHVFEYSNGKANEIFEGFDKDILDPKICINSNYGITILSSTINDYDNLIAEFMNIGNIDFDTYMKDRYGSNKELGDATFFYDSLDDAAATPGKEVAHGFIENGQYKVLVKDEEKNRKTIVTVKGIEGEIACVDFLTNEKGSGLPGMASILTMSGDVYTVNIADALPEYSEENMNSEEELLATKNDKIKNAISLLYTYAYPSPILLGEALDTGLYALTYEGHLYKLNKWLEV